MSATSASFRKIALVTATLISAATLLFTPVQTAAAQPPSNLCAQYYTIVSGDTLSRISRRFSVPVSIIQHINSIPRGATIYPGQILCLQVPPVSDPVDSPGLAYTVMRGDTLNRIARRFGVNVHVLAHVNNLSNPNRIEVGQVLIIPI